MWTLRDLQKPISEIAPFFVLSRYTYYDVFGMVLACANFLDPLVRILLMILWRNQKIDRLSKRELEFALEDAVLEIERLGRDTQEEASYRGYLWGFASASFLALAGLILVALIT